jgi:hypothetical protein
MKKELLEETTKKRWKKIAGINEAVTLPQGTYGRSEKVLTTMGSGYYDPANKPAPAATQAEAPIVPVLVDKLTDLLAAGKLHPEMTQEKVRDLALVLSNEKRLRGSSQLFLPDQELINMANTFFVTRIRGK